MTKKVKKEIQVVLTKTMPKLGKAGSLLVVRSGFARNYLLPEAIAEIATPETLKMIDVRKKELEDQENKQIESYLNMKAILDQNNPYLIYKRVGDDKKIFGKITLKQVREVLENKTGLTLNDILIEMSDIKELGTFSATVLFHPTVKTNITLEILPQ